jgi:alpha-galactosidase
VPARRWRWLTGAAFVVFGIGLAFFALLSGAPKQEDQPPARVATHTAPGKVPVKVFLLAGQNDMGGRAAIRTLDWIGKDPRHAYLLQKIKGADGKWVVRPDVWVYYPREKGTKKGPLSVGFGLNDDEIGPELLFGHLLGDHLDNQVLLIKVIHGPLSLAVEARPPSAGGSPQGGPFYQRMIQTARDVLANPDIFIPGYQGQGVELAGFVWFQGWNDLINPAYRLQYAANLAHLIRDVRRDLGVPNLPVVIGEMGVNGDRPSSEIEALREAQLLATRQTDFKGNVLLASTHDLWDREADDLFRKFWSRGQWLEPVAQAHFDQMGSQPEYLYLGSGKIFARIGEAFGNSMIELLR